MKRLSSIALSLLMLHGSVSGQQQPLTKPPTPIPCDRQQITNNLKYVAYLASKPQDSSGCGMHVENRRIVIDGRVTNPAMSCPDMFSWKLFTDVVTQNFWLGWAGDSYTWPTKPVPLCGTGVTPCCDPNGANNPGYNDKNDPAVNCPFFPGDHLGDTPDGMFLRTAQPPSKAHMPLMLQVPEIRARLRLSEGAPDPGRKIRQSMAELVFRNKPMFDFVFRNNLYHQQGIAAVFTNNGSNIKEDSAPYRLQNASGTLAEIEFPVDSIMIKSNWLNAKRAAEMGLKEDPRAPYVRLNVLSPVIDNDGEILEAGEHWLVAFHISTKDTPNWVWTTFEHVNNLGRCDYTGCSDSYGFRSADPVKPNQARNFTTPKTKCDDFLLASWIYDTGKTYDGGTINPALKAVFDALQIGTYDNKTLKPSARDRAWLSYRLKGSQTEFTDSYGRATQLGNSVTEGGFMGTSSCISCHARAGTNKGGTIPPALGVFINEASEAGYMQSSRGAPNPEWFHRSGQPPTLNVLQTDFVWGFLAANSCATCPLPVMAEPTTLTVPIPVHKPEHPVRTRIRH